MESQRNLKSDFHVSKLSGVWGSISRCKYPDQLHRYHSIIIFSYCLFILYTNQANIGDCVYKHEWKYTQTSPNTHSQQSRKYCHVLIILISVCLHVFVSERDKRMITHNPPWRMKHRAALTPAGNCLFSISDTHTHTHTWPCQWKVRLILQSVPTWPTGIKVWKEHIQMGIQWCWLHIHTPRHLHSTPS